MYFQKSHVQCVHPFHSLFSNPESSSSRAKRTGSILAAADLDEALDVGDFAGHVGGI
jgi:hypothetical protein